SSPPIERARRVRGRGKFQVPPGRPRLRLFRKAPPFWKILGDHGVFSSVLRVPVTFPPERFHGTCLSGMSVPDLRGTQGSFTFFTEESRPDAPTGGGRGPAARTRRPPAGGGPRPPQPLRPAPAWQRPPPVHT